MRSTFAYGRAVRRHQLCAVGTLAIGLAAAMAAACGSGEDASAVAASTASPVGQSQEQRDRALASAKVWLPPARPIKDANLRVNAPGPRHIDDTTEIACRFELRQVNGTTPKFHCQLANGESLKIKYGRGNPELYAEVAASRLLTALGFMADQMFVVRRVSCVGCPVFPFQSLRCFDRIGVHSACFPGGLDYNEVIDFDVAVLERKLQGRTIEATEDQGWAWFELDRIDPSRGGATRDEVDAFRLMAIFLAHWDNKSANQRLICPPGADRPDGTCARPLAIMQDLGATFGPLKVDLHNWRQNRIWKDGATCLVSMEHLPWGGGTFPERRISEGGRRTLVGLLGQLSDQQLRDLFEGSRITLHGQFSVEARRADAWIAAFKDKVEQIRAAGPCPS